ncbi:putative polyglutamine synthesis accessory protein [bacterium HR36]|nr:putative polyglutamine synthesis accessory protein [bacterium HR36]
MYLAAVDPHDGRLLELRLVPFVSQRLRLTWASAADTHWLCQLLNRLGAAFGTTVTLEDDQHLRVSWSPCSSFAD